MNAVEQVLSGEMQELLERLASSVPGGCLATVSSTQPTLRKRIEEMEERLTDARAALLEGYGRWQRTLEDLENLWALGAYRIEAMGGPDMAPQTPRRSEHPGEAGALLGQAGRSSGPAEDPVEPARPIAA